MSNINTDGKLTVGETPEQSKTPDTFRTHDWTVVTDSNSPVPKVALTRIIQDPLEDLVNEIRELKVSHQYQIDQLKLVIDTQSRIIKDLKILRFDQEAMIQSMMIEGKKISPYVDAKAGKAEMDKTSMMFPSNSFSFQRNLNWGIRSGKPTPFIAEHSYQKQGSQQSFLKD